MNIGSKVQGRVTARHSRFPRDLQLLRDPVTGASSASGLPESENIGFCIFVIPLTLACIAFQDPGGRQRRAFLGDGGDFSSSPRPSEADVAADKQAERLGRVPQGVDFEKCSPKEAFQALKLSPSTCPEHPLQNARANDPPRSPPLRHSTPDWPRSLPANPQLPYPFPHLGPARR